MKIKELKISNFRIFKGEYNFNFYDKNLIVVHGNNGNGKSTMFDSIEWAITGELLRYKGTKENQKFNYIFNNKVFGTSNCEVYVEIVFYNDKEEICIKRICKCNKNGSSPKTTIFIDGEKYKEQEGNKKIRELIMKGINSEGAFDKGKFRDMFSATQLLSQDEIALFISSKKPSERLLVMEKILGVDKYGEEFRCYINDRIKDIDSLKEKNLTLKNNKNEELQRIENEIFKVNTELEVIDSQHDKLGNKSEQHVLNNLKIIRDKELNLKLNNNIEEFTNINDLVQNNLIDNSKLIDRELIERKNILHDILEYEEGIKSNKSKIEDKKTLIEINEKVKEKVNKRNLSISYYINKRQEIKDGLEAKKEIDKINNNISNKSGELALKESQKKGLESLDIIKEVVLKYEKIENFKKVYIEKESEIEQVNNDIKILELEKQTNDKIEKNIEYNKEVELLLDELKLINGQKEKTQKSLENYNIKAADQKRSISQIIYEIQEHVINNEDIELCPICGEKYSNREQLISKVETQLNKSKKYFSDIENIIRSLLSENSKLDEKYSLKQQRVNELQKKLHEDSLDIKIKKNIIRESKINFKGKSITELIEEYKKKSIELNSFIDNNNFAIKVIYNIKEICAEIDKLKDEIRNLLDGIDEIIFKNDISNKYINKSIEYIDNRDKKYKSFIIMARKFIKDSEKLVDLNNYKIDELNKLERKYKLKKDNISKKLNSINLFQDNFESARTQLIKNIEIIENINSLISITLKDINLLLSIDKRIILKNEKEKYLKEQTEIREEINRIDEAISNNIKDCEGLKIIIDESKNIQGELIDKLIEGYSEFIDKLFFQISPHAFAKHIYLIPRKTDLYIILSEKKGRRKELFEMQDDDLRKEASASLTLSSAQKNVLGICVFISLSLSQSWTKINMMGIDDPFQNMDDINVYSFLDTLAGVLDQKQVIISTHNEDFAALISNKSALEKDKIKILELETYSQDGVKYIEKDLV